MFNDLHISEICILLSEQCEAVWEKCSKLCSLAVNSGLLMNTNIDKTLKYIILLLSHMQYVNIWLWKCELHEHIHSMSWISSLYPIAIIVYVHIYSSLLIHFKCFLYFCNSILFTLIRPISNTNSIEKYKILLNEYVFSLTICPNMNYYILVHDKLFNNIC